MAPTPPQFSGKSLFSLHYLATRLPGHAEWQEDAQAAFTAVRSLWLKAQQLGGSWNEAQTEEAFVKPVLDLLGWHFVVQAKSVRQGQLNRPDYALFADAASRDAAYPRQGDDARPRLRGLDQAVPARAGYQAVGAGVVGAVDDRAQVE